MAASLCRCSELLLRRSRMLYTPGLNPTFNSISTVLRCQAVCIQHRYVSGGRKGFLGEFVDSLKQELSKSKEMKENIQKFREEARRLEESEALRQARRKYKSIEWETVKTSAVLKKTLESFSETVKEGLEEVGRTNLGRKLKEGVEEAAKTARCSAQSVSKSGEALGRSSTFRTISQGMETVKKEMGEVSQGGPYRTPSRLRMRSELSFKEAEDQTRVFEANEEATGVVLHKDSKWYQQWKDFKDNNLVFNRGLFSKTEMSEVLTEILRADPTFDKDSFLRQCEHDIIPNVLEAIIRGELEVLKDWCYEAVYTQISHPIKQAVGMGLQFHSKVLDIDNIDVAMGKIMEQGPVLIITFQAQVVMVIRSSKGEVVEGDPEKVMRTMYAWALCRDQEELNPHAAWRVLDISASSTEQVL